MAAYEAQPAQQKVLVGMLVTVHANLRAPDAAHKKLLVSGVATASIPSRVASPATGPEKKESEASASAPAPGSGL